MKSLMIKSKSIYFFETQTLAERSYNFVGNRLSNLSIKKFVSNKSTMKAYLSRQKNDKTTMKKTDFDIEKKLKFEIFRKSIELKCFIRNLSSKLICLKKIFKYFGIKKNGNWKFSN